MNPLMRFQMLSTMGKLGHLCSKLREEVSFFDCVMHGKVCRIKDVQYDVSARVNVRPYGESSHVPGQERGQVHPVLVVGTIGKLQWHSISIHS
jgi:hypothetical protein